MRQRHGMTFQLHQEYYALLTWMLERRLRKYDRHTQYFVGMRCSNLRKLFHPRDPREHTSTAKYGWTGHIMKRTDDRWTKRTAEWTLQDCGHFLGRMPTRWADVFVTEANSCTRSRSCSTSPWYETRTHYLARIKSPRWATTAKQRNEWKMCWGPHDSRRRAIQVTE